MKKKIVFFDGDGTLWYPKKTKREEAPHLIYQLPGDHRIHNSYLMMTPTSLSTVRKLKKLGILTVILSTHPHPPNKAQLIINEKIKHFRLGGLFDEVLATPNKGFYKHKGRTIIKILKKRGIPKKQALMIGDSYTWDYKPTREVGVDALLLDSVYRKKHSVAKRIKKIITKLSDIFDYI